MPNRTASTADFLASYEKDVVDQELLKGVGRDRGVRLADIFAQHEGLLRKALEAGMTVREIHAAFQKGGVRTGFPYFSQVFAEYRNKELGMPVRRRAKPRGVPDRIGGPAAPNTVSTAAPQAGRTGRAMTASEMVAERVRAPRT